MSSNEYLVNVIKNTLRTRGFPIFYESNYFVRRLHVRMRKNNCETYEQYNLLLMRNPNEIEQLKKDLSINVTSFFRDKETFDVFKEILIKYVFNPTHKRRVIRIWSAGCATGAEPYSIAMLVDQLLKRKTTPYHVKVLASDFNEDLLSIARRGIYTKPQIKDLPPNFASEYLEPLAGGKFRITYHIKRFVDFFYFDLTSNELPVKNLDVIFCRNVLIYFSKTATQQILGRFYSVLTSGGILVIGQTEALQPSFRDYFTRLNPRHRIYQKDAQASISVTVERPVYRKHVCEKCRKRFEKLVQLRVHERVCKGRKIRKYSQNMLKNLKKR
ncbi:MAG: CheR family methyltransferase [Candidatus Hodarchaeota archaeon]